MITLILWWLGIGVVTATFILLVGWFKKYIREILVGDILMFFLMIVGGPLTVVFVTWEFISEDNLSKTLSKVIYKRKLDEQPEGTTEATEL